MEAVWWYTKQLLIPEEPPGALYSLEDDDGLPTISTVLQPEVSTQVMVGLIPLAPCFSAVIELPIISLQSGFSPARDMHEGACVSQMFV